jgi:hypothetical protein
MRSHDRTLRMLASSALTAALLAELL